MMIRIRARFTAAIAAAGLLSLAPGCHDYTPVVSDAEALAIRAVEYPEYLSHRRQLQQRPVEPIPSTQP